MRIKIWTRCQCTLHVRAYNAGDGSMFEYTAIAAGVVVALPSLSSSILMKLLTSPSAI